MTPRTFGPAAGGRNARCQGVQDHATRRIACAVLAEEEPMTDRHGRYGHMYDVPRLKVDR